jgi:hypothetical protein
MGNRGGISNSFYFHSALYGADYRFAVKIHGFDSELVIREFPQIEAQTYND